MRHCYTAHYTILNSCVSCNSFRPVLLLQMYGILPLLQQKQAAKRKLSELADQCAENEIEIGIEDEDEDEDEDENENSLQII
jgi:ABC-type siderophore export system fused ATPase/permease subunit